MRNREGVAERRSPVRYLTVDRGHAGRRVDNFLAGVLGGLPRARIYRLIRRGEVRVNGRRVTPAHRLAAADVVRVPPVFESPGRAPDVADGLASVIAQCVIHEGEHLLIVDKPAGLAVHGGTGIRGGLIAALRAARPRAPFLELAHRLDRETSGCLVVAKNPVELRRLHRLFRDGGIEKRYLALVEGDWPDAVTEIGDSLKRVRRGAERTVEIAADGKPAHSTFRVLERYADASLLEVKTATGRTHQIRVHAAAEGHALAGDGKYAEPGATRKWRKRGLRRLFLHAALLRIPAAVPGEEVVASAPLPDDLREVLARLGPLRRRS